MIVVKRIIKKEGPSMTRTTTIGLDLAKSIFQVHSADAQGNKTGSRQLKRKDVHAFLPNNRLA